MTLPPWLPVALMTTMISFNFYGIFVLDTRSRVAGLTRKKVESLILLRDIILSN